MIGLTRMNAGIQLDDGQNACCPAAARARGWGEPRVRRADGGAARVEVGMRIEEANDGSSRR